MEEIIRNAAFGVLTALTLIIATATAAQGADEIRFDDWFAPATLRIDYSFAGDSTHQEIAVIEQARLNNWVGRRCHLDSLLIDGNGQVVVTDSASGKVIYRQAFSSLFQEWQTTEEATRKRRAFENVFLVPMPRRTARVTITIRDIHRKPVASESHYVTPRDILIRPISAPREAESSYILRSGSPDSVIDLAFLSEGYAAGEKDKFMTRAREAADAIFAAEPFKSYRSRFNVVAVWMPSADSGVSVPRKDDWRNTAVGSHFDTFYSDRYLTTPNVRRVHDLLAGVPYEHIIILANTETYGGGGIFNSYLLTAADNSLMRPVVVHEFGHSFAGLADEYFYDDGYTTMYPSDTEPWEPNITTLKDFSKKWQDMVPRGTSIPTKPTGKEKYKYTRVGVYEGGGYQSKGVYRPVEECRMKINEAPGFCPVCSRAIVRMVDYYTRP